MKILTAAQTREADAATIKNEPISSIDLMERASEAFVDAFLDTFGATENEVFVFCGPGNNGGDGLAIARLLSSHDIDVKVYTINATDVSEDFATNLERLQNQLQSVSDIGSREDIPDISFKSIVIDGLFGSGLSRKVKGIFAEVIEVINDSGAAVVSIDIPSGLYDDKPLEEDKPAVVLADYTFTFQMPKLAFFLPYCVSYAGKWQVLDIGLDKSYIQNTDADYYYTDESLARSLHQKRPLFAHKGDFGRTLLISGSHGKMGAAVLCVRACLRAGVGLLTVHVPECGYQIMQISNPEAMTSVDRHQYIFTDLPHQQDGENILTPYDAIGIGPGIGTSDETVAALRKVLEGLQGIDTSLVLDADAINILGKHRDLLELLPKHTILTPHPKEFERITEPAKNDYHRLELLTKFTARYQVYVLLKGAYSAVGTPDGKVCFNSTGNPGMASGGTGDALTGIITSLRSQQYDALDAALLGAYLHGLAGDIASHDLSQEASLASDLIECLGYAFLHLTDEGD